MPTLPAKIISHARTAGWLDYTLSIRSIALWTLQLQLLLLNIPSPNPTLPHPPTFFVCVEVEITNNISWHIKSATSSFTIRPKQSIMLQMQHAAACSTFTSIQEATVTLSASYCCCCGATCRDLLLQCQQASVKRPN